MKTAAVISNYTRWSVYLSNWIEFVCSKWNEGAHLAPHDHGGAKGLVFLFWGELREQRWKEENGRLRFVDRVVMRAPSLGFVGENDIHDVVATQRSYAAHLYYPKPKEVRSFPHQRGSE